MNNANEIKEAKVWHWWNKKMTATECGLPIGLLSVTGDQDVVTCEGCRIFIPARLTAVEEPAKSMTMVEIVRPTRQQIYERSLEIIHKLRPEGCFGDPDGLYGELEFYIRALNVSPAKVEEPAKVTEVEQTGIPAFAVGYFTRHFLREGATTSTVQGQGEVKLPRLQGPTEDIWEALQRNYAENLATLRKLDDATKENGRLNDDLVSLKSTYTAFIEAMRTLAVKVIGVADPLSTNDTFTFVGTNGTRATINKEDAERMFSRNLAELSRLRGEKDALTANRDQWERNSAAENRRAGDLEVEVCRLRGELKEREK